MNLAETRTHEPLVNKPKVKKPKKAMPKVTKKRGQLNRQYMKLRAGFLELHPYCQWYLAEHGLRESDISASGHVVWGHPREGFYPLESTEIHHVLGRGKYLLDTSTWMAVSSEGHRQIHKSPKLSYERGYMLPRR